MTHKELHAHLRRRLLEQGILALMLIIPSLLVGMWGYVYFENYSLADAFLNAAMLLGGMGAVNPITSTGGKIFAGTYAMYAGLLVIFMAGLMLTPVLHYVLHRFHLDQDNKSK